MRVKRRGDDKKHLARVLAIGTECDLALLTVDDADFWDGLNAMTLGPMPSLQESVAVVGYPLGGDTISVTAGVVSRIEARLPRRRCTVCMDIMHAGHVINIPPPLMCMPTCMDPMHVRQPPDLYPDCRSSDAGTCDDAW